MSQLLVLKNDIVDHKLPPDLEWVFSALMYQCQRVFKSVKFDRFKSDVGTHCMSDYDYVLLLDEQNTYASAASLLRMKTAIDAGAQVAVPRQISSFPHTATLSINTLGGYEETEQCILSENLDLDETRLTHLPMSLFSAESLSELSESVLLPQLMYDPDALRCKDELAVSSAGIFHLFFDPLASAQEHLLKYLPNSAGQVLDVGCARGLTGQLLEQRLGCRVTGVESDPDLAHQASQILSRVIVGNVEEVEIDGRYDVIIAVDLLEHLFYPDKFLEKMIACLNPGGRLLLSVPNVGHYTVVEDLLKGRWDYMPGALNYMHFRFCTRATLTQWLSMAGFSRFEFFPITTELPQKFLDMPEAFKTDLESLRTMSFYIAADRMVSS